MDPSLTMDQIMAEAAPLKSKLTYDKAWADFMAFKASGGAETEIEPNNANDSKENNDPDIQGSYNDESIVEDYIHYFHYLIKKRDFKASSLWTTYSRLNSYHQSKIWGQASEVASNHNPPQAVQVWVHPEGGKDLHQRRDSSGAAAKVCDTGIDPDEVRHCSWILWRTSVHWAAGNQVWQPEEGRRGSVGWLPTGQAERGGEREQVLGPFQSEHSQPLHGIKGPGLYRAAEDTLLDIKPEDELFHKALRTGYGKAVIGKNYIHKIGKIVTVELGLEEPERYTGHRFCCTAATAATNAGANTLEMKRHFGWHQDITALKYRWHYPPC